MNTDGKAAHHRLSLWIFGVIAIVALAGCGDSDDGTDFEAFVRSQIGGTSDATEPREINDERFDFSEDEHAFDDLFDEPAPLEADSR